MSSFESVSHQEAMASEGLTLSRTTILSHTSVRADLQASLDPVCADFSLCIIALWNMNPHTGHPLNSLKWWSIGTVHFLVCTNMEDLAGPHNDMLVVKTDGFLVQRTKILLWLQRESNKESLWVTHGGDKIRRQSCVKGWNKIQARFLNPLMKCKRVLFHDYSLAITSSARRQSIMNTCIYLHN